MSKRMISDQQLTFSLEGFPAPISVELVSRRVSKRVRAADSGSNSPVLLALYDPDSSSWKTWTKSLPLLTEEESLSMLRQDLRFCVALPRSGMMRNGHLYQLPQSERLIEDYVGFAWPTPKATEINETVQDWQSRRSKHKMMGPSLSVAVKLWATPTARDWRSPGL